MTRSDSGAHEATLIAKVADTVAQVLARADVGVDDDLFDRGLNSLGFVRIMTELNAQHGTSLNGSELGDIASVSTIARALAQATTNDFQGTR